MTTKRTRGTGRLFKRNDSTVWWIQFYDGNGKQCRESTKTLDEEKAAKMLRKRIGQVEAHVYRDTANLRYEDVRASLYLDYKTNRRRSLGHDREGNPHLNKVARLNGFFAGHKAARIDTDLINEFIVDQQSKGLADSSINRSLSALRRMLNLAKREKKLTTLPYFPMLKEPEARQGFFEEAQYRKLYAELPDYLRLPLALGYFTAMRSGEVFAITWDQIDLLDNLIRLLGIQTKSGNGRTVPILPELRTLLIEQFAKRQPDCPYVVFKLDRKGRAVRIKSFRKAWYSACVRAGLGKMVPATDAKGTTLYAPPRGPRSKAKPKMIYVGAIFHDLRRSGVRNLVRSKIARSIAMAISGHKTESVFERYNIKTEADITDAGEKLAAYHESKKFRDVSGPLTVEMPPKEVRDKVIN